MTVLPNTELTSFFEKLKERKSEIKKFLIKAPTAFLPPVVIHIVRDAIDTFYPSKEEQLIKELNTLTEDGFEELREMLELNHSEFRTLLSLLDSSIAICFSSALATSLVAVSLAAFIAANACAPEVADLVTAWDLLARLASARSWAD